MLNFKKFSQALLLAVGLIFASSVVAVPSQAETDYFDDGDGYIDKDPNDDELSVLSDTNGYPDNNENFSSLTKDTHISNKYTKSKEKAEKATKNKQENIGKYKGYIDSTGYKNAVGVSVDNQYINIVRTYNQEINAARDTNLDDIRRLSAKYEECRSNMGKDCAGTLAELNEKVAARDKKIKNAEKKYKNSLKDYNKGHKDELKTAEKAQKKEQQLSSQKIADEYIELAALENAKKTAYKEAEKARKERNKAEKKVAEACAKDIESNECTNAQKKLNQANAKLKQLDTDISEYNKQIKANKITTLGGFEVGASKNYGYDNEAKSASQSRQEKEGDRNETLNKVSRTAQEKNKAYQDKVTEIKNAEKELAKLKARCGLDRETGECKGIGTQEDTIERLKSRANELYKDKVAADKDLAKATQEVGAARAQDAKEVAEATAKNRTEMAGALQKEAQADAALAAAQEKAAQKCKNRNSKACQKATAELEAAQQGALSAKQEANKLKAKYGASTDASSVLNEQDASEYNNAKIQAEIVCKNGKTTDACKEATEKLNALATKHVDNATKRKEAKEAEIAALDEQLKEANAACEYSKKLESKQGQAQAVDYCTQAELLKQDIALAQKQQKLLDSDLKAALKNLNNKNGKLAKIEEDHSGQEFLAFSTATGKVENGTYRGKIDYSNTDDIFKTVTRRAARIIVGLKPIVYIFAGFGLIAFAFAAIFNKISWKWFGNIAIGLFLVANMGRLIEYMVLKDSTSNTPSNATEFGNHLHKYFADTNYAWVDVVEPFTPTDETTPEEEKPDTEVTPQEIEADERGFCKAENKGGGILGGGGFMSCVKDLVASGKKAVDAVKKVKNTVDTVKSAVSIAKNAAQNIENAAEAIGKGNLKDSIRAIGEIGQNVNAIVNIGGHTIDTAMGNISGISNDIQDVGKSRDGQAELAKRRGQGEATNAVDAAMQGQKWDKESKSVERLYDGSIANNKKNGNNNGQTGFEDVVDKITQSSDNLNSQVQRASNSLYDGVSAAGSIVESSKIFKTQKDFEGVGGSSALSGSSSNSAQADDVSSKAEEFAQANWNYSQANSNAKKAANTASRLEKEAKNKEQTAKAAQDKCNRTDLPADCVAAELAQAEYEMALEEAESARENAKNAEKERIEAEKKANEAAKAAAEEKVNTLNTEKEDAEKAMNAAKDAYDKLIGGGDEEAIKKAYEEFKAKEKAYKAANIEALKAKAEYQSLIEDKQDRVEAEERIKAEDIGEKLLNEYDASKIAAEATEALNKAQQEAQAANRELNTKLEDVAKAELELHKAKERAAKTGSSVDMAALKMAEEKVKLAQDAANAAQNKADEKNKLLEPLAEKARLAKIKESEDLQQKAEADIKKYADNVAKATAEVMASNYQYTELTKAAEEARKKAESTMDPKDIAAAKAAAEARDRAKKDLDIAQKDLAKQKQALSQAKINQTKAAQAKAEMSMTEEERKALQDIDKSEQIIKEHNALQDTQATAARKEQELKQAQNAYNSARKDAEAKENAAKKAAAEADAAMKKAKSSGRTADMVAAELAQEKAVQASKEAQKAREKAQEAQEKLPELEKQTGEAKLEAAKDRQKEAETQIDIYEQQLNGAEESLSKHKQAYNDLAAKAKEAEEKARATGNASDIVAAKNAYDRMKNVENIMNATRQEIEDINNKADKAKLEYLQAKQDVAVLSETSESKEAANLRAEADTLRNIYGDKNSIDVDPIYASQKADDEYKKAATAAQQAENKAKSASENAKKARQIAEEAAKQAEKSGKDSDMRKAEELAKRAELAALEANKAKEAADQASEPLKDLENKVYKTSVEANKYQQEVLEKTMSEAKANIDVYRASLKTEEETKNTAYQRYKDAEAAAYANPSDDAAVVAAKRAYDAYLRAQTAYVQAQKQFEAEMKRYNEAELELYGARTKEAELREQRQSAEN